MLFSIAAVRAAVGPATVAASLLIGSVASGQSGTVAEPLLLSQAPAHAVVNDVVDAEENSLAYPPAVGGVETINERYPTGEVRIERQVRLDEEHNYVNHGPWKMFDRQGNVVAHGGYNLGKRTGVWTRWHGRNASRELNSYPFNRFKAPFVSTVSFKDGVMDGVWMILDSEERKVRQISIQSGKRDGATVTWAPNGEILRQSSYDNGKPVGEVLELRKNGGESQRVATYIDGRKVIGRTTNFPRSRQKKTEERYLDRLTEQSKPDSFWNMTFAEFEQTGEPMLHGVSRTWHPNGQLESEGEYRRGERVGRFTYWHANGQKRAEGLFRRDQHHGLWVSWHENGQRSTVGAYNAGAESGQWYWWQANGQLEKQQNFDSKSVRAAAKPLKAPSR